MAQAQNQSDQGVLQPTRWLREVSCLNRIEKVNSHGFMPLVMNVFCYKFVILCILISTQASHPAYPMFQHPLCQLWSRFEARPLWGQAFVLGRRRDPGGVYQSSKQDPIRTSWIPSVGSCGSSSCWCQWANVLGYVSHCRRPEVACPSHAPK